MFFLVVIFFQDLFVYPYVYVIIILIFFFLPVLLQLLFMFVLIYHVHRTPRKKQWQYVNTSEMGYLPWLYLFIIYHVIMPTVMEIKTNKQTVSKVLKVTYISTIVIPEWLGTITVEVLMRVSDSGIENENICPWTRTCSEWRTIIGIFDAREIICR